MTNKKHTANAIEILNQVVFKNDPDRLHAVENCRLNSEIAGLIYSLRQKAGLNQAELAAKIHTTQSVISRLEDADYNGHSLSMLAKIAAALNHRLVLSAKRLNVPEIKSKHTSRQKMHKILPQHSQQNDDYVDFNPADYVDNPVALARIKAHVRQTELAKRMGVSQAYISKIEGQTKVSPTVLVRVHEALKKKTK